MAESISRRHIDRILWELPDGTLHREDGPAIIWDNGDEEWMRYGLTHRIGAPAYKSAIHEEWWVNGKAHRLDGPAIIYYGDDSATEWWINSYNVTEKIKEWAKEYNIDLDNLSDEDKFLIRLHWENYRE